MPVVDTWKDLPKRLKKENLIPNTPDLGVPYWTDFKKLCSRVEKVCGSYRLC